MNVKIVIGLVLGFAVGAFCRWQSIPTPAPPALPGAILVLAMTLGYLIVDRWVSHRPAKHAHLCGGPTGHPTPTKSDKH